MAQVFKKEEVVQEKPVIEIVRDSLDVDAEGVVRFRSRVDIGSGKVIEIPDSEFDEFVTLMVQAQESREALAEQQRTIEATAVVTTKTVSETDTEGSETTDITDTQE